MFEFFKTISHLTQHLFLSRLVKVQHRGGVAVQGGAKLLTHFTNKSFLYLSFLKNHILEDVLPYVLMTPRKCESDWSIPLGAVREDLTPMNMNTTLLARPSGSLALDKMTSAAALQ